MHDEMTNDPASSNTTQRQNRSNVLKLKGEIDLHVSPTVTASLNEMIEKKPERLVVDLSQVSYMDSAGLAVLIEAMQKVEAYGGKFMLAGLQETVRSIFEISRLDQVFQIFPEADAALTA
jgi:anti-sigma B factor antagonist